MLTTQHTDECERLACSPTAHETEFQTWLTSALDEVDYGMLLVMPDAYVVHTNHTARLEMRGSHPIQNVGGYLRARRMVDVLSLHAAIAKAASHGLRSMLVVGAETLASISVTPLSSTHPSGRQAVLLMLAKPSVCEPLSVGAYARSHKLTAMELRVLELLCDGLPPIRAARQLGVAISTIRTHVIRIREKTGADSIQSLLRKVAVLPPVKTVLRQRTAN